MRKSLMVLVATLLTFNAANASDWRKVAASSDGKYIYYVDKDSISNSSTRVIGDYNNKYITGFAQITYTKKSSERLKNKLYYTKQKWIVNCNEKAYFKSAVYDYDLKGDLGDTWVSNKSMLMVSDFIPVAPDTVGEAVIDSMCESSR